MCGVLKFFFGWVQAILFDFDHPFDVMKLFSKCRKTVHPIQYTLSLGEIERVKAELEGVKAEMESAKAELTE